MTGPVTYTRHGDVATLAMDDGKANVVNQVMVGELTEALDRAESEGAVVLLAGRPGVFSGGFDLAVLGAGGPDAADLLVSGFRLCERLLRCPRPVVVACTGHAVAMGVFLVLSADYRVGPAEGFRLVANEVSLGMTMPWSAVEIMRQRLTPAALPRAVALSEAFSGPAAVDAGMLDAVVPSGDVFTTAVAAAHGFAALDSAAHAASKLRGRAAALAALSAAIDADAAEFAAALAGN